MQDKIKYIKSPSIIEKLQLADKYYSQSKFLDAITIYKTLLPDIDNTYAFDKCEIYRKLGNNYYALSDFDNAIDAYEKTLKFYTNNASIYNMLGFLYFYKDSDKSIEYYLKKIQLEPDIKNFVMLTQIMIKSSKFSQQDLQKTFEKYVDIFRPKILNGNEAYKHKTKPKEKLKIGYLSSDFHCHAMMSFVLPILENHNREKFDIHLYSCGKKVDNTTSRIKLTGEFNDCSNLTTQQLAEKIYKDEIDILIDLSGYTHEAIWALLYKPAPVQVQYLGFLGTYGMKEVDYIITDKFTIPDAKYYTEKPLYLDCGMNRFTFNTKNQKLPEITPLPYIKNKYITFGSFNCLSKINPYTVSVWSKILKSVPDSKLLIYRTQLQERDIVRFKKQFADNGIEDSRLIFKNTSSENNHFSSYLLCDIALDPIPFSGLTITIEELFMGVPTLCLEGETISSKGAARINTMLNLNELVALSETELVAKAVNLASNPEKLIEYRNNLRNIIKNSILYNDYKSYTECLEQQYISIYNNL